MFIKLLHKIQSKIIVKEAQLKSRVLPYLHKQLGALEMKYYFLLYQDTIDHFIKLSLLDKKTILRILSIARVLVKINGAIRALFYKLYTCLLCYIILPLLYLLEPILIIKNLFSALLNNRLVFIIKSNIKKILRYIIYKLGDFVLKIISFLIGNFVFVIIYSLIKKLLLKIIGYIKKPLKLFANLLEVTYLWFKSIMMGRVFLVDILRLLNLFYKNNIQALDDDDPNILISKLLFKQSAQVNQSYKAESYINVYYQGNLSNLSNNQFSDIIEIFGYIDNNNSLTNDQFKTINERINDQTFIQFLFNYLESLQRPLKPILATIIEYILIKQQEFVSFKNKYLVKELKTINYFKNKIASSSISNKKFLILIPVTEHDINRIKLGYHLSKIYEIGFFDKQNIYNFKFILPLNTKDNDEIKNILTNSLSGCYLPANCSFEIVDYLKSEVAIKNIRGIQFIAYLHYIFNHGDLKESDYFIFSEINTSASLLNILVNFIDRSLADNSDNKLFISKRNIINSGKHLSGAVNSKLFNILFRTLFAKINVRDSSGVIKIVNYKTLKKIYKNLSGLDFVFDQDLLIEASTNNIIIVEFGIFWYQILGKFGHERGDMLIKNQIKSLFNLRHKYKINRRIQILRNNEHVEIGGGMDFSVFINEKRNFVFKLPNQLSNFSIFISYLLSIWRKNNKLAHPKNKFVLRFIFKIQNIFSHKFLKSILKIWEGFYRDNAETLNYISNLNLNQVINRTSIKLKTIKILGQRNKAAYCLVQKRAEFLLKDIIDLNVRYNFFDGFDSILKIILLKNKQLIKHNILDPDFRSLYDMGVFINKEGCLSIKYLDFAEFVINKELLEIKKDQILERFLNIKDLQELAYICRHNSLLKFYLFNFIESIKVVYQSADFTQEEVQVIKNDASNLLRVQELKNFLYQISKTDSFSSQAMDYSANKDKKNNYLILAKNVDANQKALKNLIVFITKDLNVANDLESFIEKNVNFFQKLNCQFFVYQSESNVNIKIINIAKYLESAGILNKFNNVILMPVAGQSARMGLIINNLSHKALLNLIDNKPILFYAVLSMVNLIINSDLQNKIICFNPDNIIIFNELEVSNFKTLAHSFIDKQFLKSLYYYGKINKQPETKEKKISLGIYEFLSRIRFIEKYNNFYNPFLLLFNKIDLKEYKESVKDLELNSWLYFNDIFKLYSRKSNYIKIASCFDFDYPTMFSYFYKNIINNRFQIKSQLGLTDRLQMANNNKNIYYTNSFYINSQVSCPVDNIKIYIKDSFFDNSNVVLEIDQDLMKLNVTAIYLTEIYAINSNLKIVIKADHINNIFIYQLAHDLELKLSNYLHFNADDKNKSMPILLYRHAYNAYSETIKDNINKI